MRYLFGTEFLESQVFGEYTGETLLKDSYLPSDQDAENDLPVELTLDLADGSRMNCRVAGVFIEQEEEYIALETEEGILYIMGISEGEEDEIQLRSLEDEEEQEAAMAAFFRMVEEEDYASQKMDESESEIEDDRD